MLTSQQKLTIKQHKQLINNVIIDKSDHLILVIPNPDSTTARTPIWPELPYQELLQKRCTARSVNLSSPDVMVTDIPNQQSTRVYLTTVTSDNNTFDTLTQARNIISTVLTDNPVSLVIALAGVEPSQQTQYASGLINAILAARHLLPTFKEKKPPTSRLKSVHVYGCNEKLDIRRLIAEAEGNNLARSLTALPPNKLPPGEYLQQVRELARTEGWKLQFLNQAALKRKKAGAFLAVAQGSDHKDAGIIHLSYTPTRSRAKKRIALVGKGICFDTGGTNLKPAKFMHGMHEDMQGSAVALGTLLALSQLQAPYAIDCWLALAENHIGPNAYKQNDVVTACNGTSIEIIHTDAEGRMVLADTLALAERYKPDLIIDYATLTGACIYALGTRYSGILTNRQSLNSILIQTGHDCGERVWPFPIDKDFDQALESQVADVKQCTLDGEADHILAARFLQRFVNNRPWIHIDLSAGNNKEGLAHIPTDITGFGVRYTTHLLLDKAPWHDLS